MWASPNLCLWLFESTIHLFESLSSHCVCSHVRCCWLLCHIVLVLGHVPFAVCNLRCGLSNKFTVDCTVHYMYTAAYFRVPILYCDNSVEWFHIVHAAEHTVYQFTKHLICTSGLPCTLLWEHENWFKYKVVA
jgi:hypothetical protein